MDEEIKEDLVRYINRNKINSDKFISVDDFLRKKYHKYKTDLT